MSDLTALASALLDACLAQGMMIATAESCTGGMIIAALTEIAGSSTIVDRGFITYSNEAKIEMLGVSESTINAYGAVSRETALEMAASALAHSHASLVLAVTGFAGPGGGSPEKPVGLVWFGVARKGAPVEAEFRIFEDKGRDFIRRETVRTVLGLGLRAVDQTVFASP